MGKIYCRNLERSILLLPVNRSAHAVEAYRDHSGEALCANRSHHPCPDPLYITGYGLLLGQGTTWCNLFQRSTTALCGVKTPERIMMRAELEEQARCHDMGSGASAVLVRRRLAANEAASSPPPSAAMNISWIYARAGPEAQLTISALTGNVRGGDLEALVSGWTQPGRRWGRATGGGR